jgi:hypothetical protein
MADNTCIELIASESSAVSVPAMLSRFSATSSDVTLVQICRPMHNQAALHAGVGTRTFPVNGDRQKHAVVLTKKT